LEQIITVPFGYLLDYLYQFTNNYGLALILFTLVVQLVLLPINAKSKKSMMKMSRLTPKIQAIKDKYPNDQQKQNEAIQELQKQEGASMGCGGCLWSLVPMLLLLPLYQMLREPIVYMLHESSDVATQIVSVIKEANPDIFTSNTYYDQLVALSHIKDYAELVRDAIPEVSQRTLEGINFTFLGGINLGAQAQYNVFDPNVWAWDWPHIGAFLIPVLSAGQQFLSMFISQKSNNSLVTDEKGLEDRETAEKSQANQSTKMMMWMMPIMSLFIGFGVPAALALYWLIGGVIRMVEDMILTKHYRKIYDAEDAERLKKAMEQEAAEAEKERIRAERRAASPDGITANTSKKKLQQQRQQADAEAKAAAAREYAAKKGIAPEEVEVPEKTTMSGVPDRPYCKGRAYDPNRYRTTEEEE
jgi:YidC/Oxa1 family membrane protein insertase